MGRKYVIHNGKVTEQREVLADKVHEVWVKWMKYQSTKGVKNSDGSFTINADSIERWERQMNTPYVDLTEEEKTSDRNIANEYMDIISR